MAQSKRKLLFQPEESARAEQRRKRIRFKSDSNTLAYAKLGRLAGKAVDSFVGLVVDESHTGCKIAFLGSAPFNEGDFVSIQVGALPVLEAQVRWRKSAGKSLCEIGFKYIEN